MNTKIKKVIGGINHFYFSHKRDILNSLFVCALTIAIRIPFFFWPLISDEGGYAYTATWWFRGITMYSDQLWYDRPQGIFLAYKLGMALFGTQTWAIRLWGALWAAGTGIFVYLICKKLSNIQTAMISSIIYAIFSAMPYIEGFTANSEVFALLPSTASAYILLTGNFGLAGLLAAIAFMIKPSGGTIILLGGVWLLYNKSNWKNYFQYGFYASLIVIIGIIHGSITVGFPHYWYTIVGYRLGTGSFPSSDPFKNILITSIVWFPLFVLFIAGFKNIKDKFFLFFWLFSSFVGITLGKNWEYHYFIQIIPPLAFGAATGLSMIWEKRSKIWIFATSLLLLTSIIPMTFFIMIKPQIGAWLLYHRQGYQIARDVTEYIVSHTNPDEFIYVAFSEAEYYHLMDRRSPVPYTYRLQISTYPGAYDKAIATVKDQVPTYVIALNPPMTFLDPEHKFWTTLKKNYYVETYIDGVPIYKRRIKIST